MLSASPCQRRRGSRADGHGRPARRAARRPVETPPEAAYRRRLPGPKHLKHVAIHTIRSCAMSGFLVIECHRLPAPFSYQQPGALPTSHVTSSAVHRSSSVRYSPDTQRGPLRQLRVMQLCRCTKCHRSHYNVTAATILVIPPERCVFARTGRPQPTAPTPATAANWLVAQSMWCSYFRRGVWRIDPSFSERWLGFRSFSDFLGLHGELVDHRESSTARMVWLRTDS